MKTLEIDRYYLLRFLYRVNIFVHPFALPNPRTMVAVAVGDSHALDQVL